MTENRLTHKNSDSPKPTKAQKWTRGSMPNAEPMKPSMITVLIPARPQGRRDESLDAIAGRLVIERRDRPHTLDRDHFVSDSSANVGSRPAGVSLSTTPGKICDSCLVSSSSERPERCASVLMISDRGLARACWATPADFGRYRPRNSPHHLNRPSVVSVAIRPIPRGDHRTLRRTLVAALHSQ